MANTPKISAAESREKKAVYKNFCQDRIGNVSRKGSGKSHTNSTECWCEPDDKGDGVFVHYQVTRANRKSEGGQAVAYLVFLILFLAFAARVMWVQKDFFLMQWRN